MITIILLSKLTFATDAFFSPSKMKTRANKTNNAKINGESEIFGGKVDVGKSKSCKLQVYNSLWHYVFTKIVLQ